MEIVRVWAEAVPKDLGAMSHPLQIDPSTAVTLTELLSVSEKKQNDIGRQQAFHSKYLSWFCPQKPSKVKTPFGLLFSSFILSVLF